MAFKQELEEALSKIPDETYRNQMREMLEKNPEFAGGWLRQNDYDRQFAALKKKEGEWTEWEGKWKTELTDSRTKLKAAEDAAAAGQTRIAELEAKVASGDFSPTQDNQMLNEIKALKDQISSLEKATGAKFVTQDDFQKEIQKREQEVIGWTTNQILKFYDLDRRHITIFGKPLTEQERTELYQYTVDHGLTDATKAYEEKYGDQLKSKWEENKEKEIRDKITKEMGDQGIPISPAPAPELGAVQRMYARGEKEPANLAEGAARAAAELRAEGKY